MLNLKFKILNQYRNICNLVSYKSQLFRGEHFPQLADKILFYYNTLYCDPHSIIDGDIVYCDTHQLLQFREILNLRRNLTIITHNSDFYVCDGTPIDSMGINVNLFSCFKKWYSQNCYSLNKNVIPIPIGFENMKWEKKFGPKTKIIETVCKSKIEPSELVYFNCSLNTNIKERKDCYDFSIKSNYVNIDQPNLLYTDYLKKIQQHKFVLSPRGNGLDCHRTWEVLKLRRIPILKREGQLESLYYKMPVLFVDNWNDLNKINLEEFYKTHSFHNQDYLLKKYWLNVLKNII
jgi:hypothetical protein